MVGERIGTAGVRVRSNNRCHADDDERPAGAHDQRDTAQRRDHEADDRADQHRLCAQQARLRHAQWSESTGRVGAALEVERVVDEVRSDLDKNSTN